jgi:hypothetical protein
MGKILGRPPDYAMAQKAWEMFHAKKAKPAEDIHLKGKARDWPTQWGYSGTVKTIYYASDKWEKDGDYLNYYHDHGKGIGCWLPKGTEPWLTSKQLPFQGYPEALTVLGYCLGWDYQRPGSSQMFRAEQETGDELLCSFPNRKTLAVVSPRQGAVALVGGPGLIVEARGIVG